VKLAIRGSHGAMRRALDAARHAQPTWNGDPDAATFPGMRAESYRRRVGTGDAAFTAAVETVMTWGAQRGAGLSVLAAEPRAAAGGDVVIGMPLGPLLVLAPCRVAAVFDEPRRGGFRYLTLPGHPEIGFEEFVVERSDNDEVWFTARPVSRPGSVLMQLTGPVSRMMERRASKRYLDAVSSAAASR
jgi:uncharacterized protein (UPF0548 family)